jgi:hypothetical protein
LFLLAERTNYFGSFGPVGRSVDAVPLLPLGDGLLVDPVVLREKRRNERTKLTSSLVAARLTIMRLSRGGKI